MDADIAKIAETIAGISAREAADKARKEAERAAAAEQNRRDFPQVAKYIDALTPVFGKIRVIHACENGKQVGREHAD